MLEIPKNQKLLVMLGVMLAMLLAALDQTIVATAMPKIVSELNGLEHLSWVFTSYMLASTVIVPIYGKLSDMYGRKKFIISGILIFLAGSILSGLSQNMLELIIFRAIQGAGAGAIFANSFAIIGDLFTPRERGKWQGLFGGVWGLASVLGPNLGGWLTDNASWRWGFYINIPVGILALVAIIFLMPKIVPNIKERTIDFLGAFLLAIGIITLLLCFVWGGSLYPWFSPQIILLSLASIFSLSFFISVERKAKEPILPLELFKNPIFSVSMVIIFLSAMGMFGAILYVPLFAQLVLGITASHSGTIITPMTAGMVVSSIIVGQLISRTGKYKIIAMFGLGLVTISLYMLAGMNESTEQMQLVIRMIATGIGLGVTFPVFNMAVQNAFDHSRIGVATASTQLFRSVGGTIGTAILGGVLNSKLSQFPTRNPHAFAASISEVFFVGSLIMGASFVFSIFLKEIPLRNSHKGVSEAGKELAREEGNFPAKSEPV
jgi:EmrB/QacA subfamily drug resistance transporter